MLSLFFWYVPIILLHFPVSFRCFLRFCGVPFFSIRYAFCYIPCNCFAHFMCFFTFSLVSLHFAIMFHNFEILRSFPFHWICVALISMYFAQVLCDPDLTLSFDFTAFWFLLASMLLGSGRQTSRKTSVHQARLFLRCSLHNHFRDC